MNPGGIILAEDKRVLRKNMISRRQAFTGSKKAEANRKIYDNILSLQAFEKAGHIHAYVSTPSEADTYGIMEYILHLSSQKHLFLPRVTGEGTMEFFEVTDLNRDLKVGYKGITEPVAPIERASNQSPEIILVPGVAFDKNFNRMGYGKGFYDRYLALRGQKSLKVGVCYSFQLLQEIPCEENDVKMDIIVTDDGIWTKEKDN